MPSTIFGPNVLDAYIQVYCLHVQHGPEIRWSQLDLRHVWVSYERQYNYQYGLEFEEYGVQRYEGAFNVFGPHTLEASGLYPMVLVCMTEHETDAQQ